MAQTLSGLLLIGSILYLSFSGTQICPKLDLMYLSEGPPLVEFNYQLGSIKILEPILFCLK